MTGETTMLSKMNHSIEDLPGDQTAIIPMTDEELDAVAGGLTMPWDAVFYATCYAAGMAGGAYGGQADSEDVSNYCHGRYLD